MGRILALFLLAGLALGALVAGVGLYFLRPLPARAEALAALRAYPVAERPEGLLLEARRPKALLLFHPGARVDPRAYAPVLGPLVEEGYSLFLLRFPQGLALLDRERALRAQSAFPHLPAVFLGHSLGGVVAAGLAARLKAPLVLLASYPEEDLSGTHLPTLALYGREDRLIPPAKARAMAQRLPKGARVVYLEGVNHAGFGAYGPERGDGPLRLPPEEAWRRIRAEVEGFLRATFP